jgi:hypothetical protein
MSKFSHSQFPLRACLRRGIGFPSPIRRRRLFHFSSAVRLVLEQRHVSIVVVVRPLPHEAILADGV